MTVENVSVDFESPDDVDVTDYEGHEDDTSSGGDFCPSKTARAGTVPYLGEQYAGATRTYGGDDNNRHGTDFAMNLTLMGDNVDAVEDLHLVKKNPLCLLVMDAEDHYDNYIKARPPDECAPENVYRGGSPLSIIGEATCNVPDGLGIEILFWFLRGCTIVHGAWETMDTLVYGFLFRMRFEDWIGMEYPSFLFL